jgi:hypothetical protein
MFTQKVHLLDKVYLGAGTGLVHELEAGVNFPLDFWSNGILGMFIAFMEAIRGEIDVMLAAV